MKKQITPKAKLIEKLWREHQRIAAIPESGRHPHMHGYMTGLREAINIVNHSSLPSKKPKQIKKWKKNDDGSYEVIDSYNS